MTDRRQARVFALQVLFQLDQQGRARPQQEVVSDFFAQLEAPAGEQVRAFAASLIEGVSEHVQQLDRQLGQHCTHWRVERMSEVDRNVLRLAAFELTVAQRAKHIVIDEAVALAKVFGSETSASFVNGVLDSLANSASQATGPR